LKETGDRRVRPYRALRNRRRRARLVSGTVKGKEENTKEGSTREVVSERDLTFGGGKTYITFLDHLGERLKKVKKSTRETELVDESKKNNNPTVKGSPKKGG